MNTEKEIEEIYLKLLIEKLKNPDLWTKYSTTTFECPINTTEDGRLIVFRTGELGTPKIYIFDKHSGGYLFTFKLGIFSKIRKMVSALRYYKENEDKIKEKQQLYTCLMKILPDDYKRSIKLSKIKSKI